MARLFDHDRLVIASHNPGKVSEIADLMQPFVVEVISAADLNLDEPEETGTTFVVLGRLSPPTPHLLLAQSSPNPHLILSQASSFRSFRAA